MSERTKMHCRAVRKRFDSLAGGRLSDCERETIERHLGACDGCSREYRLFTLSRAVLDLAASPEEVRPDDAFFKGLRARIERGPLPLQGAPADESWAGALWITARQLVPAMAMLLALIIGATVLWSSAPATSEQTVLRPRDRILFSELYDYPAPTQDDVLESLVAVEEIENGQ
ncbi:MAG TPA: hypothetical protein VNO14_12060 [Blastocatellia bacterium]|nr:hypothetical protein [Blastocatellia bacterium]